MGALGFGWFLFKVSHVGESFDGKDLKLQGSCFKLYSLA